MGHTWRPGRQRLELCPRQWQQRLVCAHGQWHLEQRQHELPLWCGAGLRFLIYLSRAEHGSSTFALKYINI